MDESTSSLDSDTEEKFINDVFSYSDDKTIIFISHKASALKKCDKIYDLNKKIFEVTNDTVIQTFLEKIF